MNKRIYYLIVLLITTSIIFTGCATAGGDYRDGKKYFFSGDYEKAAKSFEAAIKKNPDCANYYIDYGMTLIALERYEDALAQFDRAYLNKDLVIVKENNKRVLRGRGICYIKLNQYEKAISEFEKALSMGVLSELDMDILFYMGSAYCQVGLYEKANESYSQILEIDQDNTKALVERANTYRIAGEYDKSLADYDQALSLEAGQLEYYLGKYFLLMENGKTREAEELLGQASQIKAKTSEDSYHLAKIHFYQKHFDEAMFELEESLENGFTEANYYIGEIYRLKKEKDYQTAIYYYEKYIQEADTINPIVYNQIASCLMKLGKYEQALGYLEEGISYGNTEVLRTLLRNEIISYENLGKFDIALDKLESYLESYPTDQEAIREGEFLKTRQASME